MPMTITHARIRAVRQKKGMTGNELARRVNVSPSYISLIEKGEKVPKEDVAVRIARALNEPEEAYRIWAATHRMSGPVKQALRALENRAALGDGGSGGAGNDSEASFSQLLPGLGRSAESFSEPRIPRGQVLAIPLLADGADLQEGPVPASSIVGEVPMQSDLAHLVGEDPVALRVSPSNGLRIGAVLQPNDIVILDRRWAGIRSDSVYAVRLRGSIVLCHCLYKGSALLIFSDDTGKRGTPTDVEVISTHSDDELRRHIAGRVALSLRVWN